MTAAEGAAPVLGLGARVEVDDGVGVLICRLRAVHGRALHLDAPPGARRSLLAQEGVPLQLTVSGSGVCWEAAAATRQWVWMRPPLLVVGVVGEWRKKRLRNARRVPRQLAARIAVAGGREYLGRTQDVSAGGVSLLVPGLAEVEEGAIGWLTLQIDEDNWCDDLPIRIARVRNWLRSTGRAVEIGAQLQIPSESQGRSWQECLARLGVEP